MNAPWRMLPLWDVRIRLFAEMLAKKQRIIEIVGQIKTVVGRSFENPSRTPSRADPFARRGVSVLARCESRRWWCRQRILDTARESALEAAALTGNFSGRCAECGEGVECGRENGQ